MKKSQQAQASRAEAWRRQADNDLKFAKAALRDGFYAQCCFICQQASEKALKAILIARGNRLILSHSLYDLCRALRINGPLLQAASILDQYYLTGRYPDALPGPAPFEVFSKAQASEAVRLATVVIRKAAKARA